MSNAAALAVRDLTVAYSESPALWDVDLEISVGTLTAIVGPNGAGKSTLIKAALGLVPVVSGTMAFFGRPLNAVRAEIAYVPQRSVVDWDFPITVFEVALMGTDPRRGWFKRPGSADRERATQALERVNMLDLRDRPIGELSGGQQQRVFLARALAQDAQLYLLDEPFTGVDQYTEETLIGILRELRDSGRTVIAVHHDLQTASDYFDQTVLLNVRLFGHGPSAELLTPERIHETYTARPHALAF